MSFISHLPYGLYTFSLTFKEYLMLRKFNLLDQVTRLLTVELKLKTGSCDCVQYRILEQSLH